MLTLSRWKAILVTIAVLFGVVFTLPNLLPQKTLDSLPGWVPHQKLNLGLDLQGGSYLLLEVDTGALKAERLSSLIGAVRSTLRAAQIPFSGLSEAGDTVNVRITDPGQTNKA